MTREQIIAELQYYREHWNLTGFEHYGETICNVNAGLIDAAVEALKAQEPKTVKRWKTSERMPYCPNDSCGRPLHGEWQKYCEYCGQAVKWE